MSGLTKAKTIQYLLGSGLLAFGGALYVFDRLFPPVVGCPPGIAGGGWSVTYPVLVGAAGIIWLTIGPKLSEIVANRFGGKHE